MFWPRVSVLSKRVQRLLRCSWLMSDARLEPVLGTDERTGARFMPRFQDLPHEAFFPQDEALMLFGKVSKNRFSLDYCAPLTLVQALSVALSAFADKLVVT